MTIRVKAIVFEVGGSLSMDNSLSASLVSESWA
jgi:hypothetical protein